MRHWHTHEDEFIFVLSGEVVVKTDAGEQVLGAGMCAGFPASADGRTGDGHQLINRSSEPAVYLEISNRDKADQAFYPDVDLHFHGDGAAVMFTRKDGSQVAEDAPLTAISSRTSGSAGQRPRPRAAPRATA